MYQPACPGCPRFAAQEIDPERCEQLRKLADRWGCTQVEFISTPGEGYRQRVKLSARGALGQVGLGIFEAGSHRLVAIPNCPVHHPSIQSLLPRLTEWLNEAKVAAYDEPRHRGILRAVQLAVEPKTRRIQVVLIVLADLTRNLAEPQQLVSQLEPVISRLKADGLVHSIWLNGQPEQTNTLVGENFFLLHGPRFIEDLSGDSRVFFPPGAFGQAHPELHARAVARIFESVPEGSRVTEYYAGVGSIGLGLLSRGDDVRFNEVGAGSLEGLREGVKLLGHQPEERIFHGRAGLHARLYGPGDSVIVDPPRKGLDAELLQRFVLDPPARLIYLSCGLDSLLREAEQLEHAGLMRLKSLTGFSYFPFTRHVETLAIFERPCQTSSS